MNQHGGLQKTLVAASILLIATVSYMSCNPEKTPSIIAESGHGELIAELVKMEARLQQQIADLKPKQTLSNSTFGHEEYAVELERVNRQLAMMMARQKDNQRRFNDIEMRFSQLAVASDVELASVREMNVLSAALVEFKTRRHEPVEDKGNAWSINLEAQLYAIQQQVDTYERHLFEEAPDPQWTSTIKMRLSNVLKENQQLSGIHVQQSYCGVSMCKLEVYLEDDENVEEKVQMLMANRPWQGESFVSFELDGNGAIFFARDGEMLP